MSKSITEIAKIALSGTDNGIIEIAVLSEPYGEDSESVASIGIFLNAESEEPDWKVHIPKGDIVKVTEALQKAAEAIQGQ